MNSSAYLPKVPRIREIADMLVFYATPEDSPDPGLFPEEVRGSRCTEVRRPQPTMRQSAGWVEGCSSTSALAVRSAEHARERVLCPIPLLAQQLGDRSDRFGRHV